MNHTVHATGPAVVIAPGVTTVHVECGTCGWTHDPEVFTTVSGAEARMTRLHAETRQSTPDSYPNLVNSGADVTVTTTAELHHMCPHVDEADHGTITITWRTNGSTIELHSLADYLAMWKDSRVAHEDITDRIRHDLSALPGIELITVDTRWRTAGIEVTCSTSPTPPHQL